MGQEQVIIFPNFWCDSTMPHCVAHTFQNYKELNYAEHMLLDHIDTCKYILIHTYFLLIFENIDTYQHVS